MDDGVSGQWVRFISLCLWSAWRYDALRRVSYGRNLALIINTITLTLIRLSLREGMKDADSFPVKDS